ncbi:Uma2 family endonuclease [Streptomyces sp. NPDC091272]|uniref:Uma2 family endonuclease n=1 Tax=Streptomyces sp. NPDC091272 TaxID=3365981 RepID=UPI0038226158
MSAQPPEPHGPTSTVSYRQLCDLAEAFESEADRRGIPVWAEVGGQEITVQLTSRTSAHARVVSVLGRQIENQDEAAVTLSGARVHHPAIGLCRTSDLVIMAAETYERRTEEFASFAPDVLAVVEVVSPSNPGNDYVSKLRDYPRMGVPEYVIVDPRNGTVTVHSGPDAAGGEPRYADARRHYKFGDVVPVGPWAIDTAKFPRYLRQP